MLGVVDFDSAVHLQDRLVYDLSGRDDEQGILLLCEHPPLITIGREGRWAQVLAEPEELTARALEIKWLARGGGCYLHAPGQLAMYLLLPLDRLGISIVEYRRRFEEAIVSVCREMKIAAKRDAEHPGLWSRNGQIAFFGAAVKSGSTCHGMFLNVNLDLDHFRWVAPNPPGRVASLESLRTGVVSMHPVRESVMRNLAQQFGYEKTHIYTGHPLLRRTTRRVCVHA